MQTQSVLPHKDTTRLPVLYLAIEMAEKSWKLGFTCGERRSKGRFRCYTKSIDGGDWTAFSAALSQARRKLHCLDDCPVISCYEAGQDGFHPHRIMTDLGIDTRVVDSASIEVNRRLRRAKTDRLDLWKLMELLVRSARDGEAVWQELRIPSVEQEDNRRCHRELERLKNERKQHSMRIRSLLKTHGLRPPMRPGGRGWSDWLGTQSVVLPPHLHSELLRETTRLELVQAQCQALTHQQQEAIRQAQAASAECGEAITPVYDQIHRLSQLKGIGSTSAWILVMELFGWRRFRNRREVGSCAGLDPVPYDSGESQREQGISKAGNRRVRWLMVELAWCWLRYQPGSALAQWYRGKFVGKGSRLRRVGIVALARKLLVSLWRYLEDGLVPSGAMLKEAV